jgi:hypothetical protein
LFTILAGALIVMSSLALAVGGLALMYRFVPVSLLQAQAYIQPGNALYWTTQPVLLSESGNAWASAVAVRRARCA